MGHITGHCSVCGVTFGHNWTLSCVLCYVGALLDIALCVVLYGAILDIVLCVVSYRTLLDIVLCVVLYGATYVPVFIVIWRATFNILYNIILVTWRHNVTFCHICYMVALPDILSEVLQ